jgi:hypothetical protein
MGMWNTNGYKIETMYFYYIVMKIYLLFAQISTHLSIFYVSKTPNTDLYTKQKETI